MGAERIQDRIELYRFKEFCGTYSAICTLIYDDDTVFVKGLHGTIDIADSKELKAYVLSQGVKKMSFIKKNKFKTIVKNGGK